MQDNEHGASQEKKTEAPSPLKDAIGVPPAVVWSVDQACCCVSCAEEDSFKGLASTTIQYCEQKSERFRRRILVTAQPLSDSHRGI